jgi:predicted transposase YbfD/YdcC
MARVTESQRIEDCTEADALEFFGRMLADLPDPRRPQGVRYPLKTVIVTALMAAVCGCDDADAMEAWGEANAEWLATFLPLPHGPPTQDVFLAVLGALDPAAFGSVLRSWAALLAKHLEQTGKHIAVDGKTSRRSFDLSGGRPSIHTVHAFLSDAGLVLGAVKTQDKSNEITAIPELLSVLNLRGTTVTIDAMGCQTEIAKAIVDGGGSYLLAAKDNQPTLTQNIVDTFAEARDERRRAVDEHPRPAIETYQETDKGHGRVETRTVTICRDKAWLTTAERWLKLAFVVEVVRERTVLSTGKTSTERAYYIGSDDSAKPDVIARTVRRHWAIENELHWVLDMGFREDEARHRARNTAQNMTTVRHFALNIIRRDKTRKLGVANSRRRAGWDRAYLMELLKGAAA